jgi:hypothetical protein
MTPSELHDLQHPLTEIEKAELSNACREVLTPSGMALLRRALFQLDSLTLRLGEVERERDEQEQSFDLRWSADMRAIKRWQAAHPGKELVWPDHADLCVWLLEQLERTGDGKTNEQK